jgi:acyl-CoA dehydrogenase
MTTITANTLASRTASSRRSEALAPTCRGLNYYDIDGSLRDLLPLYMAAPLAEHLAPHLGELGALAGTELHDLSETAERHPAVLHTRDRYGRDEEWIEHHPAYRAMEEIAFGRFGIHALSHRGGVLGWPEPMPPVAKYVFHYLFAPARSISPTARRSWCAASAARRCAAATST